MRLRLLHNNTTEICTKTISTTTVKQLAQCIKMDSNPKIESGMEVPIIDSLCREGRLKEALVTLHDMDELRIPVDSGTYASLLHACNKTKAFAEEGRR